jgi:hypothetical protein
MKTTTTLLRGSFNQSNCRRSHFSRRPVVVRLLPKFAHNFSRMKRSQFATKQTRNKTNKIITNIHTLSPITHHTLYDSTSMSSPIINRSNPTPNTAARSKVMASPDSQNSSDDSSWYNQATSIFDKMLCGSYCGQQVYQEAPEFGYDFDENSVVASEQEPLEIEKRDWVLKPKRTDYFVFQDGLRIVKSTPINLSDEDSAAGGDGGQFNYFPSIKGCDTATTVSMSSTSCQSYSTLPTRTSSLNESVIIRRAHTPILNNCASKRPVEISVPGSIVYRRSSSADLVYAKQQLIVKVQSNQY